MSEFVEKKHVYRIKTKQAKTIDRCYVCGFRVRGKKHEEGIHHKTKQHK